VTRPAHELTTPTLFQIVKRAVEVCDPQGKNDGLATLLARFEDRDEPVTADAELEQELAEAKGAVDPQDEDPAVVMAVAVATYLAYRRTELTREPEELLRLAARAEFDGHPPEPVAAWLAERGVRY
jgi:hypothetical protein